MSSASSEFSGIEALVAGCGLSSFVSVRRGAPPLDAILVVPTSVLAEQSGTDGVSRRQLANLVERIRDKLQLRVEWIASRDSETQAIEDGLAALLRKRFGAVFSTCYLSYDAGKAIVWLDLAAEVSPPNREDVDKVVSELLGLYGLASIALVYGDDKRLPSVPAILRRLKQLAPCDSIKLCDSFSRSAGFEVELRWLERRLDTCRRQGLVVWCQNRTYALAEKGLRLIPYSRSRTSSDVERVLALGRRQW